MARPFLRDAGQLTVHEVQFLFHPVTDGKHHLFLALPHPHIDLRRISLRGGLNGIVEQVGEHDHKVCLIHGHIPQIGQIKIDHDPFSAGLLVLFAEQGIQ